MLDFNDLHKTIKKIVNSTMESGKPVNVSYGTVTRTSPLQINVEQKLVLDKEFLVVSERFKNQSIHFWVENERYDITINNELKVGDKVILLREQGGQKFLVLDRVMN